MGAPTKYMALFYPKKFNLKIFYCVHHRSSQF
jgi:hypothetical protein